MSGKGHGEWEDYRRWLLRFLPLPSILAAGNQILLLVLLRDCLISFCTVVILREIFCRENNYSFN